MWIFYCKAGGLSYVTCGYNRIDAINNFPRNNMLSVLTNISKSNPLQLLNLSKITRVYILCVAVRVIRLSTVANTCHKKLRPSVRHYNAASLQNRLSQFSAPCYTQYPDYLRERARRYASAGLCDSDVSVCLSVCPSVCHTPVLCLAERKQDPEMYTIWMITPSL